MTRVKKQHYVPQFYLRKFANQASNLYVFDKFTQRSFSSHIKNVASETGFYDLPKEGLPDGISPQIVEMALGTMEQQFAKALDIVLRSAEKRGVIYRDVRAPIAAFLATQLLRTRQFREDYKQIGEQLAQVFVDMHLMLSDKFDYRPGDIQVKMNAAHAGLEHIGFMYNSEIVFEIVDTLLRHFWIIGRNETHLPLFSSDNPFVQFAHVNHPHMTLAGLASPGIEVAFPLSPKYVLILFERTVHNAYRNLHLKVVTLSVENVTHFNQLQVSQSYRQIFASGDQFELVKRMCQDNPALCKPHSHLVLR